MSSQQLLLGVGKAANKTYVDDVFSTDIYTGSGSTKTITNGLDLSTNGGMVWAKSRNSTDPWRVADSARGVTKSLAQSQTAAEFTESTGLTAFNSNGYTIGSDAQWNGSSTPFTAWSFRKATGFFDVVTYTGTGSQRTVSHNLGCKPGMIAIKRTDTAGDNWEIWHRDSGGDNSGNNAVLRLNSSAQQTFSSRFGTYGTDDPTSTTFTVKDQSAVNASGGTYVAYIFAGGESPASTATSVDFDGTGDYLTVPTSTDFDFGNGDFTIEFWMKTSQTSDASLVNISNAGATSNSAWIVYLSNGEVDFYYTSSTNWTASANGHIKVNDNLWHHVAITRTGGYFNIYIDGKFDDDYNIGTTSIPASTRPLEIGTQNGSFIYDGLISNVRVIKGTAIYTAAFNPPTEPLTNITNTKLLCCQGSSTTSATVIPTGSITASGDPTVSTKDTPFYDPAAFTFGESGDKDIIKCGSYTGNGSDDGPEIQLGWEPQFIIWKNLTDTGDWALVDTIRGIVTNAYQDESYYINSDIAASTSSSHGLELHSRGFKVRSTSTFRNTDGETYLYIAIRRPDGYVGKPAETGTDVFATDTGNSSSTIPAFDSGFPVDFSFHRTPASTANFETTSRLTGTNYIRLNQTNAETTYADFVSDSNTGIHKNYGSTYNAWMWKRHAGFDVVAYDGNSQTVRSIPHSLNGVPEMIWIKARNQGTYEWMVGHKSLNGGSNPWGYSMHLHNTDAEVDTSWVFGDTAPTSTHFNIYSDGYVNASGSQYLALLFRSVDGLSKLGSYTGNGSSTGPSVTLGFQPKFIIIKNRESSGNWLFPWAISGWPFGDRYMYLNSDAAENNTGQTVIDKSSTGFSITTSDSEWNANGDDYIYYAHA